MKRRRPFSRTGDGTLGSSSVSFLYGSNLPARTHLVDNFCYGPCDWEAYLWHWTDWFVRVDIALLGLMLSYVLVLGTRGFLLSYLGRRGSRRFLRETDTALRSGEFEEVISIARRYRRSPIAQMAKTGLSASVLQVPILTSAEIAEISTHAFQRSRQQITRVMSFGIGTLRAIGYSAPLLGCLGTLSAYLIHSEA